jgi:hypothetical protein
VKFNISQFCKFATIQKSATSFPVPIVYVIYRRKYFVDENGYDNEEEKEEDEDGDDEYVDDEDGDDDDCGSGGLVINNQTCT